jgi:SAM-dependent methyltransferase
VTSAAIPPNAAYWQMLWNTPLAIDHAETLLRLSRLDEPQRLVDLGCGWGELLLQAARTYPSVQGRGLDNQAWAIERARRNAVERGLDDRVSFETADLVGWTGCADRVVCIGASHAWSGSGAALRSLIRSESPGGYLLYGDGCWEADAPSDAARAMFGSDVLSLRALVAQATGAGWRIMHVSTADQREWDEFESTWRAGREQWLLEHPDHRDAGALRGDLDQHMHDYFDVYRGVLGFAYLVLAKPAVSS